jgi:nucleotide-binding universal stress UspA family protein
VELFYYSSSFDGMTLIDQDSKARAKTNLEEYIRKLNLRYPDHKIKYTITIDNVPVDVILKYQKDKKPDLIVMGSHGRKGFGRIIMGSVAESVFRESTCPVLIIKKEATTSKKTIKKVATKKVVTKNEVAKKIIAKTAKKVIKKTK